MIVKMLATTATLLCLATGMAHGQASNPLVGTWKLNVAKSSGGFKSGTTKIEAAGEGVKFIVDMVAADGKASHWTLTANFDGKDSPVTGDSPYGDMTAFTRIDANTTRMVSKKAGKVTVTQTIVVSADGKTRTTTTKGTNAMGQPVDTVAVYEKQ
ncbi:MAG: hypothetical protein ABIS29_07075 [Vicinamibacterales bacterium]